VHAGEIQDLNAKGHFGGTEHAIQENKWKHCPCLEDSFPIEEMAIGDFFDIQQNYVLMLATMRNHPSSSTNPAPPATPLPPAMPPPARPTGQACVNGFDGIIQQLQQNYGDMIDVTNSNDLSKMPETATGEGNQLPNDYWVFATQDDVYFVMGKDADNRGHPDMPKAQSKQDMINFIQSSEMYACWTADPLLVATDPTDMGSMIGLVQYCLADKDHYQQCTGHVPAPS
jgi:hypothetical protein